MSDYNFTSFQMPINRSQLRIETTEEPVLSQALYVASESRQMVGFATYSLLKGSHWQPPLR